ncbi:MAG: hypothetical protein V2I33_23620 [Kangiellaceae bacterium]|jgi:hypothetical protein|nr:hypothetical protein [Kangiellaceae bacterium]
MEVEPIIKETLDKNILFSRGICDKAVYRILSNESKELNQSKASLLKTIDKFDQDLVDRASGNLRVLNRLFSKVMILN